MKDLMERSETVVAVVLIETESSDRLLLVDMEIDVDALENVVLVVEVV